MAETASTLREVWEAHKGAFLALVPPPGELTLDVSCGEGDVAPDLTALGHRVVTVAADAGPLPVADATADLVVGFLHLPGMDDTGRAVREFARVLRPGGRLCLAVEHPIASAGTFSRTEPDAEFAIAGSYFEYRPLEGYFRALEGAGFLIEDLREPRPGDGGPWDRVPLFVDLRAVRS